MRSILLALSLVVAAIPARAASPSAEALVSRSVAHHDPNDVWSTGRIELEMDVVYSEALVEQRGIERLTTSLWLAPGHGEFREF